MEENVSGFFFWTQCSNYERISYRFPDDITLKDRKVLILPSTPLFDASARLNPLEFLDETYPAKTRVMGLPYSENFIILTSTVFLWSTRLTDRQTDRQTGDSISRAKHICYICCRALKINKKCLCNF